MEGRRGSFFHGTTHDIMAEGGRVLPAEKTGNSVWGRGPSEGQNAMKVAHASESENIAWKFAKQAHVMKDSAVKAGYADKPPGRAHVLQVDPNPAMKPGHYHPASPSHNPEHHDDLREWVAPAFKATGRIDVMPGRQGTLPPVNWNQFKHVSAGAEDVNHPRNDDPVEPRYGTPEHEKYLNQSWDAAFGKKEVTQPEVHKNQMDLFSGRTVGQHVEETEDPTDVEAYHAHRLFGDIPRQRSVGELQNLLKPVRR